MDTDKPFSKTNIRKHLSGPIKVWHWSNVLVIVSLLITVLLVKTIFQGKINVPLIQNELEEKGVMVTLEQAKAVAKIYTHKLWDLHVYFGYVLLGLFLLRLLLEFFQVIDQRFFKIIRNAHDHLKHQPNDKETERHFLLVRYIYLLFYLVLGLMISTGLFIKFSEDNPYLKPIRATIKDIHNFGMYIVLAYIVTHLAGLLISDMSKRKKQL